MNTKPTRVLIIEGDADDTSLIGGYLSCAPDSGENLVLTHAPRLSTACHLLTRQSFDAVLLDLVLPQTSGLDGFLKVRALRPSVPIIILTGKQDEVLAVRAVKLGAQDYFIKGAPDCQLLKRAIRYAIERKLLTIELEDLLASDAAPSRERSPFEGEPKLNLNAMAARDHFLSRISHEMRNTLATMKTAAYCLKEGSDGKLTAQQTELVDMISRNINRQTKIAENILDIARFRSGKLKIQLQPADAAAIIAGLVDEYRMSRGERRIEVTIHGDLPRLTCDPDLVAQVLRNLLDNALRYAKEKIVIEAAKAGLDDVSISVTDDGSGIPEEHLERLFIPFQQVDGPDNGSSHRGTGLGLAICKEIVEGHKGRIRVENAPGQGARFTFDLPLRDGPAKAPARGGRLLAAAGPQRPADSGKRSNLLHK